VHATFDALVKWLGFLFYWPDIRRTKDALVLMVSETLPVFKMAAERIRSDATTFLSTAKASLQQTTPGILGHFGPNGSVSSVKAPLRADVSEEISGTNIVLDGVTSEAGAGRGVARLRRAARRRMRSMDPVDPAIQDLWAALDVVGNPQGGPLAESVGF